MMNKTIKIIATATAALMMIAGVSACGSDTGGDSDKGRVYYLNLKPEASDQWKALAEEYKKETGIETTVQTAASGTYEQTLKSENRERQCTDIVPGVRQCGLGPLEEVHSRHVRQRTL